MIFNLLKAAVGVVTLPVDLVADVVVQTSSLMDGSSPPSHTKEKCRDILGNLHDATKR